MLATSSNVLCIKHSGGRKEERKDRRQERNNWFETSVYRLYNVLSAVIFFSVEVRQVTMRRCLVKLLTGVGTDIKSTK